MNKKEFTLVTFKSTHHAMAAEEIFEKEDMDFKTIPTPREVSHSCGLALLFFLEQIDEVKKTIEEKNIIIDGLFEYVKDGKNSEANRIL